MAKLSDSPLPFVDVVCLNCGESFSTDNEDDIVAQICPNCADFGDFSIPDYGYCQDGEVDESI